MFDFVYLASQSPRRSQLLSQMGVRHELLLPLPAEDAEALEQVLPSEAPKAYVQRVTRLKLLAALQRLRARGLPPAPVVCADTTVALGRTIFGKPIDRADAQRMLQELSGQTHRVLTAVAVGWPMVQAPVVQDRVVQDRVVQACSESRVRFAPLDNATIAQYVASGEPMGKAGAYAVQGGAAAFIPHISGSYTGIMGLPLFETMQLFKALEASALP